MGPYRTLGISRSAKQKQIKTAFLEKSKQCHPDKFPGNKSKEQQFKEVNEAYQILTNKNYETKKQPQHHSHWDASGYRHSHKKKRMKSEEEIIKEYVKMKVEENLNFGEQIR